RPCPAPRKWNLAPPRGGWTNRGGRRIIKEKPSPAANSVDRWTRLPGRQREKHSEHGAAQARPAARVRTRPRIRKSTAVPMSSKWHWKKHRKKTTGWRKLQGSEGARTKWPWARSPRTVNGGTVGRSVGPRAPGSLGSSVEASRRVSGCQDARLCTSPRAIEPGL